MDECILVIRIFFAVLAGMALLFYGIRSLTEMIVHIPGGQRRRLFLRVARFPIVAYLVSLVTTACIQSSSAMSSVLIEMVSADLLPFSTAIVMLLGANVGSTLAVQLLSFHVTDYALNIVGIFALFALVTARTAWRRLGQLMFPCGLILLGLCTLSQASELLARSTWVGAMLQIGASSPLFLLFAGIALAMLLNSSTATIGLVLVLASAHTLPLVPALAVMLGANVGTTLPALIAAHSRHASMGQWLALIHTGTKCIGACLLFLFLQPFAAFLLSHWPSPAMQVAMAHLGFNILLTCFWVPLVGPLTWLLVRLVPTEGKAFASPVRAPAKHLFPSTVTEECERDAGIHVLIPSGSSSQRGVETSVVR